MAERKHISATDLAEQTGLSARWFTGKAAAGKIPGAYQPGGNHGSWRFDQELFWRWWDERKARAEWHPSTNGAKSGGGASNVKAVKSASRLRQVLAQLPRGA